jgi:hypothetical protein
MGGACNTHGRSEMWMYRYGRQILKQKLVGRQRRREEHNIKIDLTAVWYAKATWILMP